MQLTSVMSRPTKQLPMVSAKMSMGDNDTR